MRVVSLTCSNTEIVCALGCAEMLVGVDDHSDFPAGVVAELPRVGPDLGIDVQKVLALEPDLVLASLTVPGHEKVVKAVAATGLPFLAPQPQSLDDVARDVRHIARRLGVPRRGEEVAAAMQRSLRLASAGAPSAGTGAPSILVQWWPKPVIAPGRQSWAHDLLALVGATHPLAREGVKSRPMEDHEVASASPEAIVLAWCGVAPHKVRPDVVLENPAFADIPAVRKDHVYCVPEAWLGRPSPRLVEGARALRAIASALDSRQGGRSRTGEEVEAMGLRDPARWQAGLTE